MELILVLCALAVVGSSTVMIGRKCRLKREVGGQARAVRTPRDFGALVLAERFGEPKSHEDRVGNNDESVLAFTVKRPQDPYAALTAAAQGAWFGKDALQNLLVIDEHVYTAMGQLAGSQLESIGDLHTELSDWPSATMGEALPERALNKLMGHLAEPIVGQHIEDLGIAVEMPALSNQSGYDLILNGEHAVNVKTVADVSSLSDHFARYPDIPVVVPGDMAGIPDNAIHLDAASSLDQLNARVNLGEENIVLVDNALSHAEMTEHAESVSDALLNNIDVGGIPFITLALSSYREVKLLKNSDTDTTNAVKNIGLDLAGTGGGAAAGAAAGAAIGSIVPVVGTAVGAISGSIAGAIVGRKATNTIKEKPFQNALQAYKNTLSETEEEIATVQAKAQKKYTRTVEREEKSLAQIVESNKRKLQQWQDDLVKDRKDAYKLELTEARQLLKTALNDLSEHIISIRVQLANIPSWKQALWPDGHTVLLQQSVQHLEKLTDLLSEQAKSILHDESSPTLVGDRAESFLQLLLAVDGATPNIHELIRAHEERRQEREAQWRSNIESTRLEVANRRYQCFQKLGETVEDLQKGMKKTIKPLVKKVKKASKSVRTEAARLGKS